MGRKNNTNVNQAGEIYQLTQFCVQRAYKSKNVPFFDDGAKCFDNMSNKRNIYITPQGELQKTLPIK